MKDARRPAGRGQLLARRGDRARAIADLTRFLELAPAHPQAPGIRGLLEQLRGR